MRVIASYCELATLNLHMLTHICVGLRKIKVSDGFRKFQMVSDGVGFQEVSDSVNDCDSDEQRFWLEASTFSNRGRSLRIADSQSAGWKPVPKHNLYSLLIALVGYWLPASCRA